MNLRYDGPERRDADGDTRHVVVSKRTIAIILASYFAAFGAIATGAVMFWAERGETRERFDQQARQISRLAATAERNARIARAETIRSCSRSRALGPEIARFYRDNGASPQLVRLYLTTIPDSC